MEKDKVIIMVGVALVFVAGTLGVLWLIGLAPAPTEEGSTTTLIIQGPDSIEVGEQTNYTLTLDGRVCINNLEEQIVEWSISRNGQLMNVGQTTVTIMSHSAGEVILYAEFSGITAQKVIHVHPRAEVSLDMETWIHPGQWYITGVKSVGVSDVSLSLYRELETGRRVEVSPSIWESYGFEEIVVHECGNYLLVAEAFALSDGRVVRDEKSLTATPYIQRGYHNFSWDNENIVQLTPADKVAIRLFLGEELGVPAVDLLSEGKLREINRIDSDYVFYKDSSRRDTLLYQTGVKSEGAMAKRIWQSSIKGRDARYVYISWDDFIVMANIGSPGVSFIDPSGGGDSGSSGGGPLLPPPIGGGPSPSPPIGGGPSPPPPIGEGPSPPPPIGGGGPSPPPSV